MSSQAGSWRACETAEVTVEAGTDQITVEPGITITAPRTTSSPRTPVYARVELFPFEHVFRAGSSIRITIDSAMGAVQSTGYWGLAGLPAPFQDTVYATPAQQSQVVLGLIPGATAQAPLPACNTIAGEPCRPNAVPVPPGRLVMP
jgi:uncharacterized protein